MIARIPDDERYWNGESFPPIISRELAIKVTHLRRSKAAPESPIRFLQKKTTCPQCGGRLIRHRKNYSWIFWECKKCGTRFGPFSDADILKAVSHKFLTKHPSGVFVSARFLTRRNVYQERCRPTHSSRVFLFWWTVQDENRDKQRQGITMRAISCLLIFLTRRGILGSVQQIRI